MCIVRWYKQLVGIYWALQSVWGMLLQRCFNMPPPLNERLCHDWWKKSPSWKSKKRDAWHSQLTKIIADVDKHKFLNMALMVGLKIRQIHSKMKNTFAVTTYPYTPTATHFTSVGLITHWRGKARPCQACGGDSVSLSRILWKISRLYQLTPVT